MKIAIYKRVSTSEQTTENQDRLLRAMAAAAGHEIVAEYDDSGISGTVRDRAGLAGLMADAKAGRFEAVAVVALDRLGRSLLHLIETVNGLADAGVALISLRESIDTQTAAGRMILGIFAALAEYERALIVERTKAGLARARAQGRRPGNPGMAAGRRAEMERRLAAGDTIREVARSLGASRKTVSSVLRDLQSRGM